MYVQYSQGLPGAIVDEGAKRIYIDTQKDSYNQELEAAYEHYLADDLDYFAIGQDYASGLYEFIQYPVSSIQHPYIKGQTIGPISFGLTVTDQNKKASVYNQEFCECMVKVLAMKARWQVRKLREAIDDRRGTTGEGCGRHTQTQIIIFIDEPYLVSLGSSFFNIKAEEVVKMLNDLSAAIHQEGAFTGIHCCGNTDWSLLLQTNIDILNFDAYNYLDNLLLYRDGLRSFLNKNGILAWGIVPTTAEGDLPARKVLLKKIGKQERPSLITPACGLSGVSLERAQEALALTCSVARHLSSMVR